jgi:hypothetical protein
MDPKFKFNHPWNRPRPPHKDREPRDFVKAEVLLGRTDREIIGVGRCTRWASRLDEIQNWIDKRADKWRKVHVPNS